MVHTFLMRWLAAAQKQRRFPRSVAADLEKLLRLGRQKGPAADLHQRLEHLWLACSGSVSHPSDLYRLAQAIKTLKQQVAYTATDNGLQLCLPAIRFTSSITLNVSLSKASPKRAVSRYTR